MKNFLFVFLVCINVFVNHVLFAQGSCGSPDGPFFVVPGNPPDYATANANGWCYNNLNPGQTYCWTYTYPSSGDFFLKIIRNETCGNCDGGSSICISPGCFGGCGSTGIGCTNTQYDPACGIQQVGGIEAGMGCTPAQVCGSVYTWCITIPAGCSTMDVCPMISSSCAAFLPVELLSFEIRCENNAVKISWATTSEENNSHFEIEKREGGTGEIKWEKIGKVQGAGNSSTIRRYEFIDHALLSSGAGWNGIFYRLKQVDFDGKSETFLPVSLNSNCREEVIVYSTVTQGTLFIQFSSSDKSGQRIVSVIDIFGKTVFETNIREDFFSEEIDLSYLPKGVYFVKVNTGKKQMVQKIAIR